MTTEEQEEQLNHADAHRFVMWAFWLSCMLLPASIYTFLYTHSQLALIPLILSTSGVLAEGAWLLTYRQMKDGNIYKFPYGTKKLENALAFLDATFILLGVIYSLLEILKSIQAPHRKPDLHTTSILFLLGFLGGCIILYQVLKARRHHESPAIDVFFHIYRFAVLRDLTTLLLIGAINIWGNHKGAHIFWSDITICCALLFILGYRSIRIVLSNFTALIELPLPEEDQLLILQSLAPDLDKMDMVGNIRTMRRGCTRVIEVEATFPDDMSNATFLHLQQDIHQRLLKHFKDIDFHIINKINTTRVG